MIQVIHRALNILEFLATDSHQEFYLTEIAEALDLNKATCANIIKTLTGRGYIDHEEQRKGYKLGHMAYKLAEAGNDNEHMLAVIKSHIDELRDSINENVIFAVIRNGKRILIHEAECSHELCVKTSYEKPVYFASTGKVILAHYTPAQRESFILRYGLPSEEDWPGIDTAEKLNKELEKIRYSRYYLQITGRHIASVTVPIFSKNKIFAAIAVYLPEIRLTPEKQKSIINGLLETARKIQL